MAFSHLQMRTYENVLGVNVPALDDGPPVDLGWRYDPDLTLTLSVDEYERSPVMRCRRSRRNSTGDIDCGGSMTSSSSSSRKKKHHLEFLTSRSDRERLLLDSGYAQSHLDHATRAARKVRTQRRQSLQLSGVSDLADKCSQRIRRALLAGAGASKSAGDLTATSSAADERKPNKIAGIKSLHLLSKRSRSTADLARIGSGDDDAASRADRSVPASSVHHRRSSASAVAGIADRVANNNRNAEWECRHPAVRRLPSFGPAAGGGARGPPERETAEGAPRRIPSAAAAGDNGAFLRRAIAVRSNAETFRTSRDERPVLSPRGYYVY